MQKIILDLNKLRKRLNENKLVNVDFKEYFGNNYNHRKQKIKIHDKITLLTDRLLEEVVYDTKVYFKNDELYKSVSVFWTSVDFKEIGIVILELVQILEQKLNDHEIMGVIIEMIKYNTKPQSFLMESELIEYLDKLILYVITALKMKDPNC